MCGFSGFLSPRWSRDEAASAAVLADMRNAIRHRGPDSNGQWFDGEHGIGFAHARLAIVELSPAGAQPMHSSSGRFVVIYNGEVYNHMDLRRELETAGRAPNWRGHSDTETLLAGFEAWGTGPTLKRAIGMFAFALWDRQRRELVLARDRIGEKPLYYGWQGSGPNAAFLFGSELKALARHPAFEREIDRDSLAQFMRYSYVAAPRSIYRGIGKLAPGSYLTLSAGEVEPSIEAYWSAEEAVRAGIGDRLELDDEEAVDRLETLLMDAVGKQMMSDVPLGAFLSGGVDSSTIAALMQAQSSQPVRTFSIGFNEPAFNEAEHAKAVARHLGTDHTELYLSSDDALELVPRIASVYDEPFADSSQIPTFLVCQMARRDVTVALSGDAGDELFGGYGRYHSAERFWQRASRLPQPLQSALGTALKFVPARAWSSFGRAFGRGQWSGNEFSTFGQLVYKGAGLLPARGATSVYVDMGSQWKEPSALVRGGREPASRLIAEHAELNGHPVETMMALDLQTYLPDDILVKVDRAAMAVSLETRVPLLDHRVVEYAWKLPYRLKVRDGETKWALRRLLYRHVPKALIERPKKGFSVPLQDWLRGPLRDWTEDLLDEKRIRGEGYLESAPLRAAWATHLRRDLNLQYPLWNALMFESWLREQASWRPGN